MDGILKSVAEIGKITDRNKQDVEDVRTVAESVQRRTRAMTAAEVPDAPRNQPGAGKRNSRPRRNSK
jgi:hypothetical protein